MKTLVPDGDGPAPPYPGQGTLRPRPPAASTDEGVLRRRDLRPDRILKDAPVLILDEATSSVDAETEAGIQEALKELMRDRTAMVIAHRLPTVRDADAIAVIDQGRVAQLGSHEELIERPGLYRKLYNRQFGAVA